MWFLNFYLYPAYRKALSEENNIRPKTLISLKSTIYNYKRKHRVSKKSHFSLHLILVLYFVTLLTEGSTKNVFLKTFTAQKVSVFRFFLVRIFHQDLLHTVFSPNVKKQGPEKLWIWALFAQCLRFLRISILFLCKQRGLGPSLHRW